MSASADGRDRPRLGIGLGVRLGLRGLGLLFLAIGVVGAFLPMLPATPFLLLALGCFGRSSPQLEARLLAHPRFGPSLLAWRTHRAMSRRAKIGACLGKAVGFACFVFFAHPPVWLALAVLGLMTAAAVWIVRRPEPEAQGTTGGEREIGE